MSSLALHQVLGDSTSLLFTYHHLSFI